MSTNNVTLATTISQPAARPRQLLVYLALVGGVFSISFTAIFTKWAAIPGPVAATYRMVMASLILTVPFLLRRRSLARTTGQAAGTPSMMKFILPAVLAGIAFALNLAFLNSALLLTSAATATLLDNTAPVWVGVGALLLFREHLPGRYWIGLALALGGAAVVTGLNPSQLAAINRGDLLAFTGAIFYAAYLLATQRSRCNLDTVSSLWTIEVTAAVALLCATLAMGLPLTGYSVSSYLALFAVAVVSQTLGWMLISYALGYLPASTAVVVLLCQPITTSLLSIPLLHETINLQQVAGGVLVLTGIYLCMRQNLQGSQST